MIQILHVIVQLCDDFFHNLTTSKKYNMIIDENLLLENGAVYEDYPAKEMIYKVGDTPMQHVNLSHNKGFV